MKLKNNLKIIAMSIIASSILIGCSSSDEDLTLNQRLAGVAIDPEIQGAVVFIDKNENGICDSGELNTTTNLNGEYNLTIPTADIGKPLVITGGIDKVTKAKFEGKLSVITETGVTAVNITPLTTLVHQYKKANNTTLAQSKNELATKLGFTNNDDFGKNILDTDNKGLLKIALQIQQVAQLVNDESNNSIEFSTIYSNIAKHLKDDSNLSYAIDNTINIDLNSTLPTLAKAKAKDLNKELHLVDTTTLSPNGFALTMDNIRLEIKKATNENNLTISLHNNSNMRVNDTDLNATIKERVLCSLGYSDLNSTIKDHIKGLSSIDFINGSIYDMKSIIESNSTTGLDATTIKAIKLEKMLNDAGLHSMSKTSKEQLRAKFENNASINLNTLTFSDFNTTLHSNGFVDSNLTSQMSNAIKKDHTDQNIITDKNTNNTNSTNTTNTNNH